MCSGSGTVALAALAERRKCLGIERVSQYATLARNRVQKMMCPGPLFGTAGKGSGV